MATDVTERRAQLLVELRKHLTTVDLNTEPFKPYSQAALEAECGVFYEGHKPRDGRPGEIVMYGRANVIDFEVTYIEAATGRPIESAVCTKVSHSASGSPPNAIMSEIRRYSYSLETDFSHPHADYADIPFGVIKQEVEILKSETQKVVRSEYEVNRLFYLKKPEGQTMAPYIFISRTKYSKEATSYVQEVGKSKKSEVWIEDEVDHVFDGILIEYKSKDGSLNKTTSEEKPMESVSKFSKNLGKPATVLLPKKIVI